MLNLDAPSKLVSPPKLTWNLEEASQATGIGNNTIRRAISLGRLKANRVGRRLLIPDEELRAYVGSSANGTTKGFREREAAHEQQTV